MKVELTEKHPPFCLKLFTIYQVGHSFSKSTDQHIHCIQMSHRYLVTAVTTNHLIWIGNKNGKFLLPKEVLFLSSLRLNELIVY